MNDVFIINFDSEENNELMVLAQTLQEHSIKTDMAWLDLEENTKTQEGLLSKLKTCFVLVLLITERFIESFLDIFRNTGNTQPVLPILHNVNEEKITEKYPLLADYNYLTTNDIKNEAGVLAKQISNTVDYAKAAEAGQQLALLSQNLYKFNLKELDNLANNLYDTSLLENCDDIILNIQAITKGILHDIAKKHNIYTNEDMLGNILKSRVLDDMELTVLQILGKDDAIQKNNQINIVHFVRGINTLAFWYAHNYFKTAIFRYKNIEPASQNQLSHADLIEIYNIETLVFPKEIAGKEDATSIVLESNAHSIAAARDADTGQIVAFVCAYPITQKFYDEIVTGKFNDTNITDEDVASYKEPGYYKLYISSFCVHPKYTRTKAFSVVYTSFLQIVEDLADRNIFISEILADTATKKGAFLCRSLGMKKYTVTDHGTVLYKIEINNDNIGKMFVKNKRALELYREQYK
ncbi:MAG: hypothetical protein FWG63_11990 [Defluviitaleaceae bacterium]|nr:hypothetical protein [Defluviitaleaceae bacterium]